MDSPACAGGGGLVGSLAGEGAGAGFGAAVAFFSAAARRWAGSSLSTSPRRSNWFLDALKVLLASLL